MIGQTLGHYKILEKLGAGGMGEVYRAEDTTLDREVALKILPPDLAESQERLDRFHREAKTLAALDHPNIVTIHSVEQAEDVHFLTMQVVEGKPLSHLIPKGGMPLERIFEIAIPLADALATAHEKGVVHRDLKPANIMVTDEGRVKVLDFGLAKLRQEAEAEVKTQLPTEPLTEEGQLLGTAPYMSPEQVEGKMIDSRSDAFSLGIVLYEMAAGARPFQGESSASTMARILEAEPEQLGERRSDLPPELLRIVRRCLRKKPEDRYNDTRDLLVALKDLREDTTSGIALRSSATGVEIAGRPKRGQVYLRPVWITVSAALVLMAALGLWWVTGRPKSTISPLPRERQQLTFSGQASGPAISADGNWIAYVEGEGLMVREVSAGQAIEIFQAIRFLDFDWSPDGSRLIVSAVISEDEFGNYILPRLGGSSRPIGSRVFRYLSWSPDGRSIAGASAVQKEIWLMDADSGEIESLQLAGSFLWLNALDWSPSGRFLLFVTSDSREVYSVQIISKDGEVQHLLLEEARVILSAGWAASDEAIYYLVEDGPLQSVIKLRFDPDNGKPVGQPLPLLTGQEMDDLDLSPTSGKLVHAATSYTSNLWEANLSSEPGTGCSNPTQLTFGTSASERPEYSPDRESVAFLRGPLGDQEVHVQSLDDDTMQQVTFSEGNVLDVAWSKDSKSLAYILDERDRVSIWLVIASGDNPRLLENTAASYEVSWSPGQDILYQLPGNRNFNLLSLESGDQRPLLEDDSVGWAFGAAYSPEADHVALFWNRGTAGVLDRPGVWVVTLADRAAHLVHQTPFFHHIVRWSDDAKWVYALRGDNDQQFWLFKNPELIRISADGTTPPELVCELPFETGSVGSLDISAERRTVVASVARSESDIWLVSNFDPEVN